jgi:hypothetical protein
MLIYSQVCHFGILLVVLVADSRLAYIQNKKLY